MYMSYKHVILFMNLYKALPTNYQAFCLNLKQKHCLFLPVEPGVGLASIYILEGQQYVIKKPVATMECKTGLYCHAKDTSKV